MKEWRKLVLAPETTIKKVIECLNSSGAQIVLVVDHEDRLLGTITDGDLRRFMLTGKGLNGKAADLMHHEFRSVPPEADEAAAFTMMKEYVLRQIPIVDKQKRVKGLFLLNEFIEPKSRENTVLIMAGGLGTRLLPLTEVCPKPMLSVGGKPILETIIKSFIEEGFHRFVIAINYLGEKIRDHFGSGESLGVTITYLEEKKRLGTGGALSLMGSLSGDQPVVMANGDVLTQVKYAHLLNFHTQTNSEITICLRDYRVEVPYGVVNIEGNRVTSIIEKPVTNHYISAGIYVIEPHIIRKMPPNCSKDMPEFITELIEENVIIAGYPLHEYWMDVGQRDELKLADQQFNRDYK